MTPNDFCYWLQGFIEINDADPNKDKNITEYQVQVIKDHLNLVFEKKTPDRYVYNYFQHEVSC
jgi:hypothetical protein